MSTLHIQVMPNSISHKLVNAIKTTIVWIMSNFTMAQILSIIQVCV